MPELAQNILLALSLLALKHTIADFCLQAPYQYLNKGTYGHPGGLLHAGIHAVLTIPVFLLLPPAGWLFAGLILAGEFVIHDHVDWIKEQCVKRKAWTPDDSAFWAILGVDQFAHTMTYLGMVAVLLA